MHKKVNIVIGVLATVQLGYGQQELVETENPFSLEAAYVSDVYSNAAGGLKTGGGYMGMGNLQMGFDTEKARWWKGGSFFINGANIHGKSLSEHFAGDLQVASNIDAGNHSYLHELWFKQEFENFSFTVGLQDLNADFLSSENAGEFINSSFGIPPVISCNLPVPIFPLTGLGVSAQWNISKNYMWQSTFFDGHQTDFENNPHNIHWKFYKDDGVFIATEFHAKFTIKEKEGTYTLGTYYHSGLSEFDEKTQLTHTMFKNNYGFYFIADQTIFKREQQKIGLFTQVTTAPKSKNVHCHYLGLGANYYGIFSKSGKDILGLAAAFFDVHKTNKKHETAIELYYKWQFNDTFAVQPDIQYIINPSGTDAGIPNALLGMVRLHINF
ncbi:MAG: carbohydrate porin [Bacteroidales bacterium]|jgi:porin|nr:carbohydrate porin [Bacteroidales bacterium]